MVSPALAQLLERARVRVGLEVEILDGDLKRVYPDSGTELGRLLRESPSVVRQLREALLTGRSQQLSTLGHRFGVYPLRPASGRRQAAGLLAIRHQEPSGAADAEPWSDLARAVVEADLSNTDTVDLERRRTRRLSGGLGFLDFILDARAVSDVTEALVQAAAIWFDADARIYRRTLSGDFQLHTWLPGVQPEEPTRRVDLSLADEDMGSVALKELGAQGGGQTALVLPIASSRRAEWALALLGVPVDDVDTVMGAVARVAGARLEALASERAQGDRDRFLALVSDAAPVPELKAIRVLRELVSETRAISGSIALTRQGQTRRIATISELPADAVHLATAIESPERLSRLLPLTPNDHALIELRAAPGAEFTLEAASTADACATVLRPWLAGTLPLFDPFTALGGSEAQPHHDFSTRIQEELERAKRFNLTLSLVVIDIVAPFPALEAIQDAVRQELRGSDVTGTTSSRQLAALLTHTDAAGLDCVVRRLRQRLTLAADRLNVSELRLGQAAFSSDCGTAAALLSRAAHHAEPLIVH